LSTDDVSILDYEAAVIVLKDNVVGTGNPYSPHSDKVTSGSVDNYGHGSVRSALPGSTVEHASASSRNSYKATACILLHEERGCGNLITNRDLGSTAGTDPVAASLVDDNDTCGGIVLVDAIYNPVGVQRNCSFYVDVLASYG
jgi:hypothetical protein